MPVTYTPAASEALFEQFAGQPFADPIAYAAPDPRRVDAKFFLKPLQDEVLHLIRRALDGAFALPVRNASGAELPAGALVYVAGWSVAANRATVLPALASEPATRARFFLEQTLADDADGLAWARGLLTGLDTSLAAPGDPVYLDDLTPGAFTLDPPASAACVQQVGVVTAADLEDGAILFFPEADQVLAWNSAALQDASVTPEKISAELAARLATLELTPGLESADELDLALQVLDARGDPLAGAFLVEVWLADTATGWESATPADSLAVLTGELAETPSAHTRLRLLTASDGSASLRVTYASAQTWYARGSLDGAVYTSAPFSFS